MDVSKRIINLRERCGLTQNGLAKRAGVSQTHLSQSSLQNKKSLLLTFLESL